MFYREISEKLKEWKLGKRKPLIDSGLRQVGKTTTILNFCDENYQNVVYLDFRKDKTYASILRNCFSFMKFHRFDK